jgi:hypothetical protein
MLLLAGAIVLAATAAAQAEDATFIPAAPPEDVEFAYDIPLQPWLVPTVLDLKIQFADGLSAEFNGIAENQTGEELTTLVEAGRELSATIARIKTAVDSIGVLDVTFGIEGISRMIPAESALRDTLFGFIVWHEFSSTPARGMMTRFESLVGSVAAGGEAAAELAAELAASREHLEQAVTQGDLGRIAELSPCIIETSGQLDAVCGAVAIEARDLGALVDSLSIDSPELLVDRWADASRAAADAGEPAQRTGPALESMSGVLHILVELGGLLEDAVISVDALSATPEADGNLYISWTAMRSDWELARDLTERVLDESTGQAAEGEHEHGHVGDAATKQAKARIRALLVHQVEANALLAERAVEHTSTLVAEVADTVEEFYLDRAGYSNDLNDKRKAKVFEQVDSSLREDMEFMSAKTSAKAARAALAAGRACGARGVGSEISALYNYQNAWLHCLNAGAAAQRATGAASSR